MAIKACKTKFEKKYFSKSFGVTNLQTFGHFFVRKYVAPKLLGINIFNRLVIKAKKLFLEVRKHKTSGTVY